MVTICYTGSQPITLTDHDRVRRQSELQRDPKVRRLLRLYHLLGNDQQLEKWQRFISPSSDFSFGTSYSCFYL